MKKATSSLTTTDKIILSLLYPVFFANNPKQTYSKSKLLQEAHMRNSFLAFMSLTILSLSVFLSGCVPTSTGAGGSASLQANKTADQSLYKPVHYANAKSSRVRQGN